MSGRWKTAFEHLLSAHTSAVNPTKAFSKPQGRSVNLRHEPFFIILLKRSEIAHPYPSQCMFLRCDRAARECSGGRVALENGCYDTGWIRA